MILELVKWDNRKDYEFNPFEHYLSNGLLLKILNLGVKISFGNKHLTLSLFNSMVMYELTIGNFYPCNCPSNVVYRVENIKKKV